MLAFHFPQYLSTPELRKSYDVATIRLIMYWAMVVAGGISLYNILFARTRWLAASAFFLVAAAALLGGAKVPVNNFADHTPYIGLDWFILDLLGSSLIFVFIEKLFALRREQPVFRAEWQVDMQHFIVNHMIVGFVLLATNLLVHKLFGWAAKDGIQGWVRDLPYPVALFLIVLVADLVQYATHRAYHEVPTLWRLHAVHHSVKSMDWLAGSRQHVVELLITRTLVLAPIFVLGFDKSVIDTYIVIVGFQAVFNHANVSVRLGPLRYLIVTPNFHHWHHSQDDEAIDKNYAAHFAFIDYLFGTAVKSDEKWPEAVRRRGRLRARRLLEAGEVSVHLEGLSAQASAAGTLRAIQTSPSDDAVDDEHVGPAALHQEALAPIERDGRLVGRQHLAGRSTSVPAPTAHCGRVRQQPAGQADAAHVAAHAHAQHAAMAAGRRLRAHAGRRARTRARCASRAIQPRRQPGLAERRGEAVAERLALAGRDARVGGRQRHEPLSVAAVLRQLLAQVLEEVVQVRLVERLDAQARRVRRRRLGHRLASQPLRPR